MGKILQTSIALMITFFVVGTFMTSTYYISTDANKTTFQTYGLKDNKTMTILSQNNATYTNQNDSVLNIQNAAQNIEDSISAQTVNFSSNTSAAEKVLNAFGLAAALALNVLILFFAILVEGVNFTFGIANNLLMLPPPWNAFGGLAALGVALMVVYLVFKLVSAYVKWDI